MAIEKEVADLTPALRQSLLTQLDPRHRQGTVIISIDSAGPPGQGFTKILQQLPQSYLTMAAKRGWKFDLLNSSPGNVTIEIQGSGAWSAFHNESGLHRIEFRIGGRSLTNEAIISVVPSAPIKAVEVKDADIEMATFTSSGPGGQHVNKTQSAVRLTHIPTGIVVECQSERSQVSNRATALKILTAKVAARAAEEQAELKKAAKAGQTSVGARRAAPRVRTYDFIDSRVTEHRTGEKTPLKNDTLTDSVLETFQTRLENYELLKLLDENDPTVPK